MEVATATVGGGGGEGGEGGTVAVVEDTGQLQMLPLAVNPLSQVTHVQYMCSILYILYDDITVHTMQDQ